MKLKWNDSVIPNEKGISWESFSVARFENKMLAVSVRYYDKDYLENKRRKAKLMAEITLYLPGKKHRKVIYYYERIFNGEGLGFVPVMEERKTLKKAELEKIILKEDL